MRYNRKFETPTGRYIAAIALAVVAQAVRIPLHPPTLIPFITYAPFIILSASFGGFGPGLLTSILCALEAVYFAIEPVGSFALQNPTDWLGVGTLFCTGVLASVSAERLKRAGEQLAEAHRKTTAILEGVSDGFNTFDHQWRYTYVNAAAARMTGKAPEELLGRNLWDLWPHVADSPFGAAYRRAIAENVPVAVEAFYPEPLNAWFEVRCYPSTEGLTLFFTDVTERKRIEERLRLLESAFLQTSDGILILKISEGCSREPTFINPAFERMTGFNLEDLRRIGLPLLCPRPNPNSLEQPLHGLTKTCPEHSEQLVIHKNGSEFWAELDFRPLTGKDGNYTHCVWTCRDITERREAHEKAVLLSSIVEDSDDAIIGKNLNGIVLSWNKGAERIYGYTSEEIVGRSISILIPPDRAHELPLLLDDLRRGARIEHYETERVKKDGGRILISLTFSPIKNAADYIVGASVIARDITEQKRAEKALRLSEERYRSLAIVTTQIVWTTNPAGEVEDMPMWRAFTGQSVDEVKGWGWIEALHPDDRERTADIWTRSVRNQSFYDTEYRMRRHDGEYRWMAVHGVPVLEEKGTIREWVGTCADITERKQAEETLRESEQRLRALVKASSDVIYRMSPDWSEMRQLFGQNFIADTEAPDRYWLEKYIHPDDRSHVMAVVSEAIRTKSTFELEHKVLRVDGTSGWTFSRAVPLQNADGEIIEWFGAASNITEQKHAEQVLRDSEERLRQAQRAAQIGTFEWNIQTGANKWTPELEAMYGLAPGGFSGTQEAWEKLLHPEDRAEAIRQLGLAMETGEFEAEWRVIWPDGALRWLAGRASVFKDKSGKPLRLIGVHIDISERKRAEEEIRGLNQDLERRVVERTAQWEASNRELEAFAYSVSHDLRAPLRAIDGFSRILLEEHASNLPEEPRHYLDVVRSNAVQMGNLIDDLLAFSRLSRQALRKQPVNLEDLVRQSLNQLAVDQEERQVEIAIGQLPGCEADPALLKQVFVNLLSNALKYTKPRNPARIEVGALRHGEAESVPPDAAVYYVRDNGVGFDMRYVEKLFGVFQRLHRAEDFEGTGVGLAIVHRIISRHGGRIWADAAVDCGATFYFTLAGSEITTEQGPKSWLMSA